MQPQEGGAASLARWTVLKPRWYTSQVAVAPFSSVQTRLQG
jgi:hypothetical protein